MTYDYKKTRFVGEGVTRSFQAAAAPAGWFNTGGTVVVLSAKASKGEALDVNDVAYTTDPDVVSEWTEYGRLPSERSDQYVPILPRACIFEDNAPSVAA